MHVDIEAGADPDDDLALVRHPGDRSTGPGGRRRLGSGHGRDHLPAGSGQRAQPAPTPPAPRSGRRCSTEIAVLEKEPRELPAHIGGRWRHGGGAAIEVVQPHDHQHVLGTAHHSTRADAQDADRRGPGGGAGLARPALRRPLRDHPQGRRPAGRSVAPAAQRRDRAGPVEDGLPGRDRLRLRAHRLLALQRPLRQADPHRPADRQQPGRLEPHRPPPARGLRLRDHAVQLHRDRRQPAHRPSADGQRGALEALRPPSSWPPR